MPLKAGNAAIPAKGRALIFALVVACWWEANVSLCLCVKELSNETRRRKKQKATQTTKGQFEQHTGAGDAILPRWFCCCYEFP
jgi:hypothetical protein